MPNTENEQLLLFLGSGFSAEFGLATTQQLGDRLLETPGNGPEVQGRDRFISQTIAGFCSGSAGTGTRPGSQNGNFGRNWPQEFMSSMEVLSMSIDVNWISAIATLLAVAVALFNETFWRWIRKPTLTCSVTKEKTIINVGQPGKLLWAGDCYYLRLWIHNCGRSRAEKVQVLLSEVTRENDHGVFRPVKDFLPMNLRWTHSDFFRPEIFADGISPNMGKFCDLASICDPANPTQLPLPGLRPSEVTIDLWTEVFPNTLTHRLLPDIYRFTLKIAAANCQPTEKHIEITVKGPWYVDEDVMLSDGIIVRELD